ncbi:DNA primase [Actinomarinicola tropica]|uniref:DNA primase n=1 Tax=Actinomarinicola tropica TaxID=2789776 RepID=A0A5Q2RR06_9ACTN|nr:DNA primase [Actinomarinicola tropica]QGG95625.1 DNA primase [Actinomarinicola tropica]
MGIVDEDIAAVREASDIVAIVSQYTQLKRVGRRFTGLCPFHSEKSPSFSVNAEQGLYYCFGCQAKGDVITFIREIEHTDFVGAVETLAGRSGVTLRYTDRDEGESRKRKARLIEAVARAVDWYHERLKTAPDAGPARSYLRSRGFTKDTVERYKLGWAPDDWDQLVTALKLPDDVVKDSGLGFRNRRGRQQDAFRGRVLFPIFDAGGDPVAFGGRILPGAEGAKYINSHESPIYSKSRALYGLNWAKAEVVRADEVIICEGYTDVIAFGEAGLGRAVATCGTALTESHVQILRKYARRVVLAFDADAAGQSAAERFYEWERRFEVDVAVAALPRGVDPADLAREDPAALEKAVVDAKPFLGFRLDRVLGAADLSTPEGRARGAEAALAVIAEHPSALVRDQYLMAVADRCRIDVDRLRDGLRNPRRRQERTEEARTTEERPTRRTAPRRNTPELEALRLAVHRRDEILPLLDPCLFDDELLAAALDALTRTGDLRAAIAESDPETADLLQRLAVEESEADPIDVVGRLVTEATRRTIAGFDAEARQAGEPLLFSEITGWLNRRIMEMREPATEPEARDALLAWLRQRAIGEP